jgi:hypothetical protein
MYYTPETLLNHVFEDLRKPKAPNTRVKCYICRVVADPQMGINQFGSPLLLGYEDLVTALHRSDK